MPNNFTYLNYKTGEYIKDGTKIIAEDFTVIPANCCRKCHEKIKPYSADYERTVLTGGSCTYHYNMNNSYCEDCAKMKAGVFGKSVRLVEELYMNNGSDEPDRIFELIGD